MDLTEAVRNLADELQHGEGHFTEHQQARDTSYAEGYDKAETAIGNALRNILTDAERAHIGTDVAAQHVEVEHLAGLADAAVEVDYRWHQYVEARTPLDQAQGLLAMCDPMHDMRSWLPGYEVDHDTLPWQREDDA